VKFAVTSNRVSWILENGAMMGMISALFMGHIFVALVGTPFFKVRCKLMQIPKRFKLLGHTVEVGEELSRYYEKGSYGACSYEGHWIKLVPPSEHHPITRTSLEQTFLHELVHMILYNTEQAALSDNEHFVDLFAGLLHQALTTMEYE
jgi:hypothetical protein